MESVTKYFGVQFQHHYPVEDARAVTLIALQACRETGLNIEEWLHRV